MDVFEASFATWPPAEVRRLGPWTLRRGEGGGGRVSAATLDGPAEDPGRAAAAMREMGQQPLFMVRPGDDALDATLAAQGYKLFNPTAMLAAPLAALSGAAGTGVIRCDGPLASMAEIWRAGGIGPGRLAVMDRAPEPRVWLLARLGDRPVGCAFVAIHAGTAMLHALQIDPVARRQGVGSAVIGAAAVWGKALGGARLALAVSRANAAACALYARAGMTEIAGYHYRTAPEAAP